MTHQEREDITPSADAIRQLVSAFEDDALGQDLKICPERWLDIYGRPSLRCLRWVAYLRPLRKMTN